MGSWMNTFQRRHAKQGTNAWHLPRAPTNLKSADATRRLRVLEPPKVFTRFSPLTGVAVNKQLDLVVDTQHVKFVCHNVKKRITSLKNSKGMSITICIFPIIHHLIQNSKHIKQLSPTCSAVFHVSIPSPQKNNGKTFPLACSLGTFGLRAQHHEPELSELQEWFHMELGFAKSHGDSKSRNDSFYLLLHMYFIEKNWGNGNHKWKLRWCFSNSYAQLLGWFRFKFASLMKLLTAKWRVKPWVTQADCSRCVSGEIRGWDTPHAQGFPAGNNMGFTLVLPTCLSKMPMQNRQTSMRCSD